MGPRARFVGVVLVAACAMLAAARAHAGWRENTSVSERPNQVLDVWGDGTYSLGFKNGGQAGAYLFLGDGRSRKFSSSLSDESVGTAYQPATDCFVSMNKGGYRKTLGADGGTCAGINEAFPLQPPDGEYQRVKAARDGGAIGVSVSASQSTFVLSDQGIDRPNPNFTTVLTEDPPPQDVYFPFAAARVGSQMDAFIGLPGASASVPRGYWVINSLSSPWMLIGDQPMVGPVQAVELFSVPGSTTPYAMVGALHSLLQGSTNTSAQPMRAVQALGANEELQYLAMNVEQGSEKGWGFGMALVEQADGGTRVMSPVPMESLQQAGTVWRPRTLPADAGTAKLGLVACQGSTFCAFSAPGQSAHNLYLYSNDVAPAISAQVSASADNGGTAVTEVDIPESARLFVTFRGTDGDDDPVRLAASAQDSSGGAWSVRSTSTDAGEPVVMELAAGSRCQTLSNAGTFEVTASDGLKAHDALGHFPVAVLHTLVPPVPTVTRTDGGTVAPGSVVATLRAGGESLTLDAVGNVTPAGCLLVDKHWELAAGGPTKAPTTGSSVTIIPPRYFCEAQERDFRLDLQVKDEGGLGNSASFLVRQQPWGAPDLVFDPNGSAPHVFAGTPLTLEPERTAHGCLGTPGFPGVVTTWDVKRRDGEALGPDFSFQPVEGGPAVQGFPTVATGLVMTPPHCQPPTSLVVSAQHALKGRDEPGASSQREVFVDPSWRPLSEGALEVGLDESAHALNISASALDCEAQRGLHAELSVTRVDSSEVPLTPSVAVPGSWPLPETLACGVYRVSTTLKDSTGERAPLVREWVLPPLALETAPQATLKAVCGEGASVPLKALAPPSPGACQTPDYTWTPVSGPPLQQVTAPDGTAVLTTREGTWDELIGGLVKLQVVASKGSERVERALELPITVDPFVTVEHRTEVPSAAETGFVGVRVRLTNTTACDVSGVDYAERLEGLVYVDGSAKLDGEPVVARGESDALSSGLHVEGLSLAGGATRTLSYVARPRLVGEPSRGGEPRMQGEAHKGTQLLSFSEGAAPPPGRCGCGQADPAPMLLGLTALLGRAARRRPTRRS